MFVRAGCEQRGFVLVENAEIAIVLGALVIAEGPHSSRAN